MMRVMGIAPYKYLPARKGGEIFIANFAAHLAHHCRLTIASVSANQPEGPLPYELWKAFGNSRLRYLNIFNCRTLAKAVRQKNIQLLYIEHPYMGWQAILVQILTGCGYVVHSHNIEAARWRSLGKWWWPLLQAYEKWVHRKAQHNFFISQDDADAAIKQYGLKPHKASVAPYGIKTPEALPAQNIIRPEICGRHHIAPGTTLYYFNGALDYLPNQQAVLKIIREIDPLLKEQARVPYVILISGRGLPEEVAEEIKESGGRIIYTGFVDQPVAYLAAADIFINPVVEGGGVKTKVLEALAAHKTVISTRSGAIGVDTAICGNKLKVVPDNDWRQFAARMQELDDISSPTPSSFFSYHNNERIAAEVAAIMQAVL
ncbi:glycosyltransferase family 4 protein [uncultured Chitinophaga sp.]|jgi:Glycosyltransferase|uniref:glycosyltransferase family 4 protein n=1 Tax=uncultured Chitinophaga sp. TaxID=339340 RepID=UPI0026069F62|nr:glycosyltransferase family 4 protein [uncultured Chitinophaga sp.]